MSTRNLCFEQKYEIYKIFFYLKIFSFWKRNFLYIWIGVFSYWSCSFKTIFAQVVWAEIVPQPSKKMDARTAMRAVSVERFVTATAMNVTLQRHQPFPSPRRWQLLQGSFCTRPYLDNSATESNFLYFTLHVLYSRLSLSRIRLSRRKRLVPV